MHLQIIVEITVPAERVALLDLHLADLGRDGKILQTARALAQRILDKDPELGHPLNVPLRAFLEKEGKRRRVWGRIS